jgi:hypothetical protein
MGEDPFSGLYGLMRTAGQEAVPSGNARLRRGTVLSSAPLKIDVAGTAQEAERFWICDRLRKGHSEKVSLAGSGTSGSLSVSASCAYGSHDSMEIKNGTLNIASATAALTEPVLKAGDEVLLLTADDQMFYILDRVVRCI